MRLLACLCVLVFVFLLDHTSKIWALDHLAEKGIRLCPGINLELAFNTGAAFSFLAQAGGWQKHLLVGFALVMSSILVFLMLRYLQYSRWIACCAALVLAGALGNACDRWVLGFVVDFIDLYVGRWHWFTFNIADVAICLGLFGFWLAPQSFWHKASE